MEPKQELLGRIEKLRTRWNRFVWLRGLAWVLGTGIAALIVTMSIAESASFPSWAVILLRIGLLGAVAAAAVKMIVIPLRRRPDDAQLARFVEERHPGLEDRLVSAVEIIRKPLGEAGPFGFLLVRDALERTRRVRFEDLVNRQKFNVFAALSGGFGVLLFIALYLSTMVFPYGSARLFAGFLDAPAAPVFAIELQPGDITVPRGSDVILEATTAGFDPSRAEVYLRYENSSQWESSTMEVTPKTVPTFRHLLFNVQEAIRYYVSADGHKSAEFVISVADLPRVESVDYTYTFPSYSGLPSRTEENAFDMVALRGTTVDVTVHASQDLEGGRLVFTDGAEAALTPSGPQLATARVTVDRSATFRIELVNTRGQKYLGLSEYAMEALDDQKPIVQFTKPGRDHKASTVEEVFTELEAEDDLGVNTLEIYFSVNGGEEERLGLFSTSGPAPKEISGSHTFFLEEYELEPGDFITYYGKAADSSRPANATLTDIYFIEIRPFGMEYFQGQAGQQGGGGGMGNSAEALSQRQRQIIAATFGLIRDKASYTAEEYSDNIRAVAESQTTLADQTETLLRRLGARELVRDQQIAQLAENLEMAIEQMGAAAQQLREENLEAARPYEDRALQYLSRAESVFNQIQVTRGGGGGGGGGRQNAEDLADLFDLELDQSRNQYETLQRGEMAENQSQEIDEALRKLEELAQRQQRMLDEQRQQALQGGGGGGGQQMTAEEIRRETERLARELDRLSRENNDPQMAQVGRALQQAANNMRQAANGSSQQQQEASEQALEELQRAQRLLAGTQGGTLEERLANLQRQAGDLAEQQREIADRTERLAASPEVDPEGQREQITGQKQEAVEQLRNLQEGLDSLQNADSLETSSQIRAASNAIRSNRLVDKMNNGQQLLDNGYFDYAAQREREIEQAVNDLERQLGAAAASAANTEESQLQNALNQTSETIRRLESMQRRLENAQNQQGQQEGQQPGQPGQEGQQAQQGQPGQAGGANGGDVFGGPYGGTPRGPLGTDIRQLTREWEERLRDVESIRDQLGRDSAVAGDLGRIMEAIRRRMNEHRPGDPAEIEALTREIIDPFRSIELELSRELQMLIGRENIRSAQEDEIPADYRALVEEYYKRLAEER